MIATSLWKAKKNTVPTIRVLALAAKPSTLRIVGIFFVLRMDDMGWSGACLLNVEKINGQVVGQCQLWTRGGLDGVQIAIEDCVIPIPREVILEIVAGEYRSKMVAKYEHADTEQLIAEIFGSKQ
jgi:hypothetical protein